MLESRVSACIYGHLHVDRMDLVGRTTCYCVNSASYFWQRGMHPYKEALFALIEIGTSGLMVVEGVRGDFAIEQPITQTIGCSASIASRRQLLG